MNTSLLLCMGIKVMYIFYNNYFKLRYFFIMEVEENEKNI